MRSCLKSELAHTHKFNWSHFQIPVRRELQCPLQKNIHFPDDTGRSFHPYLPRPLCRERLGGGRGVVWFKNIRLAEFAVHWSFPPQAHKIHKPWFYTNPKQLVYRMPFFSFVHTSLLQLAAIAVKLFETIITRLVCGTDKTENYEEFEEINSGLVFFSAGPTKQRSHIPFTSLKYCSFFQPIQVAKKALRHCTRAGVVRAVPCEGSQLQVWGFLPRRTRKEIPFMPN